MINLNDLCVIERPVKSIMESSFINVNCNDLKISENAKSFFKEAFHAGFLCPRVEIKEKQVVYNYGIDLKYVRFIIGDNNCIIFTYGTLGKEPKSGVINDPNRQLTTLSEFLFPKSKVKY